MAHNVGCTTCQTDLSTCLECFLIWHGACVVVRKASRIKENPSNDHPPKNTAAGLLGSSQDEARVSLGRMIHLARPARRSSHGDRRRSPFRKLRNKSLPRNLPFQPEPSIAPWLRKAFTATALALATIAPALAATDGGMITDFLLGNGMEGSTSPITARHSSLIWSGTRSAAPTSHPANPDLPISSSV